MQDTVIWEGRHAGYNNFTNSVSHLSFSIFLATDMDFVPRTLAEVGDKNSFVRPSFYSSVCLSACLSQKIK